MIRVLVSSCLLGNRIRYNGLDAPSNKVILSQWHSEGRLVHFCPEISVGFPVPRPAAETVGGDGMSVLIGFARVLENTGSDVTELFLEGAERALDIAKKNQVKLAVLTDGSPSCGSTYVYDGTFNGSTVLGRGVTAELLEQNGVRVFSENQIESAAACLQRLEISEAEEASERWNLIAYCIAYVQRTPLPLLWEQLVGSLSSLIGSGLKLRHQNH